MNIETPFDDLDLKNEFNLSSESLDLLKNLNQESENLKKSKEDLKKRLENINSKISGAVISPNGLVSNIGNNSENLNSKISSKVISPNISSSKIVNVSENLNSKVLLEVNLKIKNIVENFNELKNKFNKFENNINKNNSQFDPKSLEGIKKFQLKLEVDQISFFEDIKIKFENLKKNLDGKFRNLEDVDKISDLNSKVDSISKKLENINNFDFIDEFKNEKNVLQSQIDSLKINNLKVSDFNELKSNFLDLSNKLDNLSDNEKVKISSLEENLSKLNSSFDNLNSNEILTEDLSKLETKLNNLTFSDDLKHEKDALQVQIDSLKTNNIKFSDLDELKSNFLILTNKLDNFSNQHNADLSKLKSDFSNFKTLVTDSNSDDFKKSIEEEISKNILNLNKFLNDIKTEIKANKENLEINIENKFINSKKQFENQFNLNLKNFDSKLKEKESDFLNKLMVLDEEKNLSIYELNKFKEEISKFTKDEMLKLKSDLKILDLSASNFEKEKDGFLNEVESKKEALRDFSLDLGTNIKKIINEEKEIFEIHENTFREVFNEKLLNLQKIQDLRITEIEKKFVDKNVKIISDKINVEVEELELIKEDLINKDQNLNIKFNKFDSKINEELSKLKIRNHDILEENTTKFNEFESYFDKKFSKYDGNFKEFKIKVVNEIENLMKDVDKVIKDNDSTYRDKINKLTLISNNEVKLVGDSQKTSDLKIIDLKFKNKISNLKEDFQSFKSTIIPEIKLLIKGFNNIDSKKYEIEIKDLNSEIKSLKSKMNSFSNSIKVSSSDFNPEGLNFEISHLESDLLKLKGDLSKLTSDFDLVNLKNIKHRLDFIYRKQEQDTLEISNKYELEIENLKRKINNLTLNKNNSHSMNDQVERMAEYEDRLLGLINNLKYRNFSKDKIKEILINKGHPRFYITMILNNLN